MHPLSPKTVSLNIKEGCRQHCNLFNMFDKFCALSMQTREGALIPCTRVGSPVQKELMVLKYCWLVLLLFYVGMVGCTLPSPSDSIEFEDVFELSTFLKTHVPKLSGQVVEFQVINAQGGPVPFGLLKFQWIEGGRMSFQTNPSGQLHVEFEKDILEYEVMVSAESKGNKVRVRW